MVRIALNCCRMMLLLAFCTALGCNKQRVLLDSTSTADTERTAADIHFESNKQLFAASRNAGQVIVYEGLPHQSFDAKLLEAEKQQKPTITLHGYPFYRTPLELSAEDLATVNMLLVDERAFLQWIGEKKCGGFHPDYLIEYRFADSAYRYLICFGCHEVMVFGPERSLRCDIQREVYRHLELLLKKYRKNRPASMTN
jgi:hypothetical protein